MPEGPEVETVRLTLLEKLPTQDIDSIWRSDLKLRTWTTSKDFDYLVGQKIKNLSRKGKVLVMETQKGGMVVQLGMSGKVISAKKKDPPQKHTHLRISFKNSPSEWHFIDPRRFGDIKPYKSKIELDRVLNKLGPDGSRLNLEEIESITKRLRKKDVLIKVALLDQNIVSGIGNIYASEALHLAKVSPKKRCSAISANKIKEILKAAKKVLEQAIERRGTSFMSFLDGNGKKGNFQNYLRVFAKENEPCPECKSKITKIVQSGRSTFYCTKCQR